MDQYSEIERLYRSALPADRLASRSDPASARRLADMIVRSCRQVDRRDPLLAAVVDGCEQTARGLEAFAAPDCATARQCADQMRGFIALIRELIDTVRRNEPVIERHVSDPACREALLTPEQTAAFEDALPALERFAEAVESQDPEQVEAATADMERASKAIENTPSAKEQLERLRSACRPSV